MRFQASVYPAYDTGMPLARAWVGCCGTLLKSAVITCAAAQLCAAAQTALSSHPSQSALSASDSPAKQQFESAMAAYQQGRYPEALNTLQQLLRSNPDSPDVNELAGLVLAATGQNDRANPYLAKAVRLAPTIVAWSTALAVNLLKLHRNAEAEHQFRNVVEISPRDYDANHNLGEFYIQSGNLREAIRYLIRAQEIRPADYNNSYDLALAWEQVGDLDQARRHVLALISVHDTAELHSLLGEIEEKSKNYIAAAREYEKAAHMEPSEGNMFAWGAELLLHQTFDPAIAVFQAGINRFPQAARLHLGLGIALYGSGRADDAARTFCEVWDHDRSDPLPLTFAGKTYDSLSAVMADHVRSRLAQFVQNGGHNAAISYYYGMALWKQHQQRPETVQIAEVESSLITAIALDPGYTAAHLQLGVVYAEQHKYAEAAMQYEQAVKLAPDAAATHYRLGQVLARMGDKSRAEQEFVTYERLRNQEVADNQKQNADIQQFVYTMRGAPESPTKPK
jgi:tetratricopeptide (TPR) repeat protein